MPMTTRVIFLAISVIGLSSCRKPPEMSKLKTLENIGLRTPIFEPCTGNHQIHPSASLDQEPHLKAALAAVPFTVQKGFFDDLGGRIRIGKSSDCRPPSSRADDALGCWRRLPDKNQSLELIVVRSDKVKEQYTLVRTFGFIYGDILLNRVVPTNLSDPIKISEGPAGTLADYKSNLASTFLGELMKATTAKDKKEVTQLLSELGIPESTTGELDFQKRWSRFSSLPRQNREAFASRVFAEAFHSQFCTKQSAARACKLFPQTMESFKPYADDVSRDKGMGALTCQANSEPKASASHIEWHSLHSHTLSQRARLSLDRGSYVNSMIAQAANQRVEIFSINEEKDSFHLTSDIVNKLMGMLSGGLSSGGSGLGGILGQLLGSLGGGGGGESLGDLGSLMGSLGLSDLFSDGGGGLKDLLGDNTGPKIPTPNPTPSPNILPGNVNPPDNSTPLPSGGNASTEEQAAMDATNRYRQSQGKSVLQIDQQMVEDCRKQAQMQAQRGGLQHWLHPAGVARAENIAYGSKSGEYTVMQQWVKSPGHHANIMSNHRFIGVGNFGNQWCQRFR